MTPPTVEAPTISHEEMARNAGDAVRVLRALDRESLRGPCSLPEGERPAFGLLERVPPSQFASSQLLAILHREGLVETRRESQSIHRMADARVRQFIPVLYGRFCGASAADAAP